MNDYFTQTDEQLTQTAEQLHKLVLQLKMAGRYDLLVGAIGKQTIEKMCIENAKNSLSRIVVTNDWRITFPEYGRELELSPVHKTVYVFFLLHPEGVAFPHLVDHREELITLYSRILKESVTSGNTSLQRRKNITEEQINETIDRLVNVLDNAINEKCSRIKAALLQIMDKYQLLHYEISGHKPKKVEGFSRVWYERKKVISIDRSLVHFENGLMKEPEYETLLD